MNRHCILMISCRSVVFFFFFNDTATTEIYTLSLHDALPIFHQHQVIIISEPLPCQEAASGRSEEHTSELQSRQYLVCRLLLEKKKTILMSHASCRYFHYPQGRRTRR